MEKTKDRKPAEKKEEKKTSKPVASQNGKATPTKAEKPQEQKPEPKTVQLLTPSDRFAKAEQFMNLQSRYERLKGLSNNVKNFKLNDDNLNSKIKLVNGQGGEVTISHPDAIREVLQICESKLNTALAETELEVMSFNV